MVGFTVVEKPPWLESSSRDGDGDGRWGIDVEVEGEELALLEEE